MNVEKHRGRVRLAARSRYHIIYIALIMLLIGACYSGIAMAKPSDLTDEQSQARTTESYSTDNVNADEATGSASSVKKDNSSDKNKNDRKEIVNPGTGSKTKPGDSFLLEDYQDPGEQEKKQSWFMSLVGTIFNIIKYVFYLGFVLAIGLLAIYGVKTFTAKYNAFTGGGQEIFNILEVRYLAPGKALCLVEVADRVLVLSLAGNNINQLSEIIEPEQVALLKQKAAAKPESMQQFQGVLEKVTNRFLYSPGKSTKSAKPARPTGKSAPRKRREPTVNNDNDWQSDLHTTGDNIRKLLDDIKKGDRGDDRP